MFMGNSPEPENAPRQWGNIDVLDKREKGGWSLGFSK